MEKNNKLSENKNDFILDQKNKNLILKYLEKSYEYYNEILEESKINIEIETSVLNRFINIPILKK